MIGFICAVLLGALAIWLIVTGTSVKSTRIGALAGFWGLLVGALAVFGTRHPHAAQPAAEPVHVEQQARQELELRAHSELVRAQEDAARRQFEARLETMLRQQIQTTMAHEVSALRSEVASLRGELLEKVGGQLRLERIETTRVIGSDIEALQREVNQLKAARASRELQQSMRSAGQAEPPGQVIDMQEPVRRPHRTLVQHQQTAPQQPVMQQQEVQQPVVVQQAVPQQPVQHRPPMPPEPTPQPTPPPDPTHPDPPQPDPPHPIPGVVTVQRADLPRDTFAGLPRLRPFTDFELDPIEPDEPSYSGRRRADDPAGPRGRHGAEEPAGGRRRAEDGHDVLARILRRENVR